MVRAICAYTAALRLGRRRWVPKSTKYRPGRMAVNQLVRQLQNQRIEALHVQLATKLVVRESTAPPARVARA